jgi:hypothetical protein
MAEVSFIPLRERVADNLEAGGPHLGGPADKLEQQEEFTARLHDRPIALSLKGMFTSKKNPPTAKLYERFDLWLVPHRFSIMRRSGSSTIVKAGCEVAYNSDVETLSIVSLIPTTEYIETLRASIGLESRFGIGMTFHADLSDTGLLEHISDALADLVPVSGSASLSASAKVSANAKINLSMKVLTPYIAAIGVGSTDCLFQLSAYEEPLFDRDIETWAVIAIPKYAEEIKYRMRCSFISRRLFMPRVWQTPWSEIVTLKGA